MANDFTFGIRITADGKVLVDQSKAAQEALRNLGNEAEKQTSKLQKLASSFFGQMAAWDIAKQGLNMLKSYTVDLVKESALLAARYETLGVTLEIVGKNAGYTSREILGIAEAVRKQGITMNESRAAVTRMVQANMDLSYAAKLARLAQDAAVIGGINSSEAFSRIIYGLQSGQIEVLRTVGLNVNFEQSYAKLAAQMGKNAEALTETEKAQARVNAAMEAGTFIAGAYEASMGTAGKQLGSLARYEEDLKTIIGDVFTDAVIIGVNGYTDALKDANAEARRLADIGQIKEWGKELVTTLADAADWARKFAAYFAGAAPFAAWLPAIRALRAEVEKNPNKFGNEAREYYENKGTGEREKELQRREEEREVQLARAMGYVSPLVQQRRQSEARGQLDQIGKTMRTEGERVADEVARVRALGAAAGATQQEIDRLVSRVQSKVGKSGSDKAYREAISAMEAFQKREQSLVKERLDRIEGYNKAALMGDQQYINEKFKLESDALRQQEQNVAKQLALAKKRGNSADATKYQGELDEIGIRRRALEAGFERDSESLVQRQTEQVTQMQIAGLRDRGELVKAFVIEWTQKFADDVVRAGLDGNETLRQALFDDRDRGIRKAQLEEIERVFNRGAGGIRLAEESAQSQVVAGVISEGEARERVRRTMAETAAMLQTELLPKIEQLRAVTTDPEILAKLDAMKAKFGEIAAQADKSWQRAFGEGVKEYINSFGSMFDNVKNTVVNAFKSMEDALVQWAMTGKLETRALVNSMLADIARLVIRQQVTGPLAGFIGKIVGGMFGGGAGAGAALPTGAGDVFGVSTVGVGHTGGIAGLLTAHRTVPNSLFNGAPRYHAGGIAGEVPAILKRGEGVFTPEQMKALSPASPPSVQVQVVNNGTPQRVVNTDTKFDPRGLIVRVFTEDMRSGGPISQTMGSTFGLARNGG